MEHGIVTDWDAMTDVWQDSFNKLSRVHGKDVLDNLPLLITEVPLNPRANRETMVEIMFETFRVPNLNVSMPGALVIQSTGGRTTGFNLSLYGYCSLGSIHI